MGEVYRARDSRLGRDVALKILPPVVASDPDRLARFEREARTVAALNHPHIAHVHGIEDTTSVRALVMELVPGRTLVEYARGLPLARQIAEGLEAARARRRPSRSEAGQYQGHRCGCRQDPGLRAREGCGTARHRRLEPGTPATLFSLWSPSAPRLAATYNNRGAPFHASADGKRFLMVSRPPLEPLTEIAVVQNGLADVERPPRR
jgi:hypothetical protein